MKTMEEVTKYRNESNQALADKKRLLLTVELDTPEQADEIFRWMYNTEKPMLSNLVEIAWDKVAVSRKQAEALEALKLSLQES